MRMTPGRHHVVHAGCGTGYYTAIVAHMVGSNGRVTAIEFDAELAASARVNLRHFPNLEVVSGDATTYDPARLIIFVNAGATIQSVMARQPETIRPSSFPDGPQAGRKQTRCRRRRMGCDDPDSTPTFQLQRSMDNARGHLPGSLKKIDSEADRRLGHALAQNGLTDVRSLRREAHDPDPFCLLHGEGYCFSKIEDVRARRTRNRRAG